MNRRGVIALAFTADVAVVISFAGVGRRSHDEAGGAASALGTAAPFLLALALAWLVVGVALHRRGRDLSALLAVDAGVLVAVATATVGLVLRRTLWDRGTAVAFVVVTAAFLTAAMGGWRGLRMWCIRTRGQAGTTAG